MPTSSCFPRRQHGHEETKAQSSANVSWWGYPQRVGDALTSSGPIPVFVLDRMPSNVLALQTTQWEKPQTWKKSKGKHASSPPAVPIVVASSMSSSQSDSGVRNAMTSRPPSRERREELGEIPDEPLPHGNHMFLSVCTAFAFIVRPPNRTSYLQCHYFHVLHVMLPRQWSLSEDRSSL